MNRTLRALAICAVLAFAAGVALAAPKVKCMGVLNPATGRVTSIQEYTPEQQASIPNLVEIAGRTPGIPMGAALAYDAATKFLILAPETQTERKRRKAGAIRRRQILQAIEDLRQGKTTSTALDAITAALE